VEVKYMLELGMGESGYGPTKGFRLIAATLDPATLNPENTWYLTTTLSPAEASPAAVYELYRLRGWIEHYYEPTKHELGWVDYQVRPERAIVRHWQLVMLAYTFSLLVGALPSSKAAASAPPSSAGPAKTTAGKNQDQQRRRDPPPADPGSGSSGAPRWAGAPLALPLGSAAGILATLVEHRPTARTGRASRPSRPLASP
jgi:hypothetical protein